MPQIEIPNIQSGIAGGTIKAPMFNPNAPLLNQSNTTCGIYAICHARALFGLPALPPTPKMPPRVRNSPSYFSNIIPDATKDVRWFATKVVKASQVGEVFSCDDMEKLCKAMGLGAKVHATNNIGLMQGVIQENVDKKRMVLVPFWVSSDRNATCGDPVKASDWARRNRSGGAHWCLLFGYFSDLKSVVTYHWGKYWKFDIQHLVNSNNDIRDWPEQTWHPANMRAPDGRTYVDYKKGAKHPQTDVTLEAKPLSTDLGRKVVVIANPRIEFKFKKKLY